MGKRFTPWPATIFVILLVLAVLFLLPTVGVLLSSIKTTRDISMGQLWSWPGSLFLGNFVEVLGNPSVHTYFKNTLLVTLPATAASITLGTLAGYVFAKLPFRGSNALFLDHRRRHVLSAASHPCPPVPPVQRLGADRHALAGDHRPLGPWPADLRAA